MYYTTVIIGTDDRSIGRTKIILYEAAAISIYSVEKQLSYY